MAAREPVALRCAVLGLWVLVALLAIAAAVLYLALRGDDTAPAAIPVSDAPAATWPAGAKRAPAFTLRDERGAPVSLAALRGRPVVITFIDPLCRDYCPTEAQHLNDVVGSFPDGEKPAVVAVSVNTAGNSRANLLLDRRKWQLVPEWRWAIGEEAALARVWRDYHVQVLVSSKTVAGIKVRTVAHTEAAYLVDSDGYQRALFLWPYTAAAVERTLRSLGSAS